MAAAAAAAATRRGRVLSAAPLNPRSPFTLPPFPLSPLISSLPAVGPPPTPCVFPLYTLLVLRTRASNLPHPPCWQPEVLFIVGFAAYWAAPEPGPRFGSVAGAGLGAAGGGGMRLEPEGGERERARASEARAQPEVGFSTRANVYGEGLLPSQSSMGL